MTMLLKLYDDVVLVFLYNFVFIYFIIKTFVFIPNLVAIQEDPYVSGDFFRSLASIVVYDNKQARKLQTTYEIQNGSIIFIQPSLLWAMEAFQKRNKHSYILLTHDDDLSVPSSYTNILNDKYLIRWFGQNIDMYHPKLEGIPIGIANHHWVHGNQRRLINIQKHKMNFTERFHGLFVGYMAATDTKRMPLKNHFCSESNDWTFCVERRTSVQEYLIKIATVQFVLSPRGNGLDCHRTWESIAMGAIPVVESSTLDPMLETENVLIINSFLNMTKKTLMDAAKDFQDKPRPNRKLYRNYWRRRIRSFQIVTG